MKDEVVNEKRIKVWITILSIAIPLVVAFLFRYKLPNVESLSFLPPIYATINGLTAICLILGVLAIRKGKQKLHQNFMSFCILLSVLFLGMYVAYHMTSESTSYGGEGIIKYIYFFILITHIVLSIVIIPLVLITYSKSYFLKDYVAHKKWARFTFPIWLYVAITGVVVYLMISPYY
jgi:putative membrane protein